MEKEKSFRYNRSSIIRTEKEAGNYGKKQEERTEAEGKDIDV